MDQEGFYPLLMSCLFNFSPVISTQQPLPFCQLAHRGGDGWHRKVSLAVLAAPRNGNLQHGEAMCVAEGMGNSHSSCLGATRMPWLCGWALNSVFAAAQLTGTALQLSLSCAPMDYAVNTASVGIDTAPLYPYTLVFQAWKECHCIPEVLHTLPINGKLWSSIICTFPSCSPGSWGWLNLTN